MRYFDTAYIIKLYLVEDGSGAVMQAANESGGSASSSLACSELHSALHRNFRDGRLDRSEFAAVLDRFDTDVDEKMWYWLPITMSIHCRVESQYRQLPPSVRLLFRRSVI